MSKRLTLTVAAIMAASLTSGPSLLHEIQKYQDNWPPSRKKSTKRRRSRPR
jgi:hypothetical protein